LVECPSADDPLDDFCANGRDGLGYVEFVGSEYYFSAATGSLDPQEAPLPNKLLLFVEAYESSDITNADNGCKITTDGMYTLTNPQDTLASKLRNSVHNQIDNSYARARSGVVNAKQPGTNSAQARTQLCVAVLTAKGGDCTQYANNPSLMYSNAAAFKSSGCQAWCTDATKQAAEEKEVGGAIQAGLDSDASQKSRPAQYGKAGAIYINAADKTGSTSDCVNGVFCGGRNFGEPCSGRGLCNYADGTCQCHSGYAGNACQEVEEMA
jgi:hypothetical protein